jgi:ornithine carbamoyltransferase
MDLVDFSLLTHEQVHAIWNLVDSPDQSLKGNAAWSFEGNGIRTRTTFIQAFRELGLSFVELPNFLKTAERAVDLAGYLDPFYDVYVVRESNHQRLIEFAAASCRPVINAMSSMGHPCEVLTDAYYIDRSIASIAQARICLWGPPTNVLRSWHDLARSLQMSVTHICDERLHEAQPHVKFVAASTEAADVVITDGWPSNTEALGQSLTLSDLERMGNPALLPTPPFSIGREIAFDPLRYPHFVGYKQKELLLPVQKAILRYAIDPKLEFKR